MLRLPLLILIVLPLTSSAADLLACVDPDVSNAFLVFQNEPDRTVSDDVPDYYTFLGRLQNLVFIGSSVSDRATSVAYHSTLPPDEAQSVVEAELLRHNWMSAPIMQRINRSGFQSSEVGRRQSIFCNDRDESISIAAVRREGKTYVRLWGTGQRKSNACTEDPSRFGGRMGVAGDVMPDLASPPGSVSRGSGSGGIIIKGGDDAHSHIRLETELESAELLSHFELQLADQNWIMESNWAGERSIGSVWSLSEQDLPESIGTLQVFEHPDGDRTIRFTIVAM